MRRNHLDRDSKGLDELPIFQEEAADLDDEQLEDLGEYFEEGELGDDESLDYPEEEVAGDEPPPDDTGQEPEPAPAASGVGGLGYLFVGVVLMAAGIVLTALATGGSTLLSSFIDGLERSGASPNHLILFGLLLSGYGIIRRHQAGLRAQIARFEHGLAGGWQQRDRMEENLNYLVEAQQHHFDRPPASGEELERVLACLQRQEEKINNLTRATKMYGKPLVEISHQVSTALQRIEDNSTTLSRLQEAMDGIREDGGGQDVAQDMASLKEVLAALSKSVEASNDALRELDTELKERLAGSEQSLRATMTEALGSLKDDREHGDPDWLNEIRTELSALTSSLTSIRTDLSARPVAPPRASHSRAAAPAPAPPSEPAAAGGGKPPAGLASSIAGTRKGSGKNVLGAIAKLKQMRE